MKKLIIYSGLLYFFSSALLGMDAIPKNEEKERDVVSEHQVKSARQHTKLTHKIKGYYDSTEKICPFENDPQMILITKADKIIKVEKALAEAAVIVANSESDTETFVN